MGKTNEIKKKYSNNTKNKSKLKFTKMIKL